MAEVKFVLYSDPDFMLVKSIRMQVFMNEQNIKGEEEFDELDKRSLFALLFDGNSAVATARISEIPKGLKIGRIAVLKDYRGRRYGHRLLMPLLLSLLRQVLTEFMLMLKTMPLIFTKSLDFAFAALNLLIEE